MQAGPQIVGSESLRHGGDGGNAAMGHPFAGTARNKRRADEKWLQAFADGFFGLAHAHQVDLIGGDTTRDHSISA